MEVERTTLTPAERIGTVYAELRDAKANIVFVCRQVADGKMTPEMALLRIHVTVLADVVSAFDVVEAIMREEKDRKEAFR